LIIDNRAILETPGRRQPKPDFARDFARCVNTHDETAGIKVYAPRGILSFTMEDKIVSGQTVKDSHGRQRSNSRKDISAQ
jgi:hypothetical protein